MFNCSKKSLKTFNLKDYYNKCQEEVPIQNFKADLLLSFKKLNDAHIFVAYLSCSEDIRIKRMHSRNDDPDKILSRIESDRLAFTEQTPLLADVTVDSEKNNQLVLAEIIYKLYTDYLSSL